MFFRFFTAKRFKPLAGSRAAHARKQIQNVIVFDPAWVTDSLGMKTSQAIIPHKPNLLTAQGNPHAPKAL